MKNFIGLLFLTFLLASCGGDDCQTCTGEVFGEQADATICDNGDGTWTSTDNITGETMTDTTDFQTQITLAEGLGLDCK